MEMLSIQKAAELLGVHPRTVRRYINEGRLHGERFGRNWRVSEEALKALLNDAPDLAKAMEARIRAQAENNSGQYQSGGHPLQRMDGGAVTLTYVFEPTQEPWVLEHMPVWMQRLNEMGKTEKFDFTMTNEPDGLCRIALIAPIPVAREMLGVLEMMRGGDDGDMGQRPK